VKLKLHHLNLCTTNVPAMDEFYRSVLDLAPEPAMGAMRIKNQGYGGEVSFVTDGTTQVHLSEKDLRCGFRTGHVINPVERGHIAFRTDDIEAFKRRLDDKGIPYSDYGGWAMEGWQQIFFHDPDGNVIEVHQAPPDADGAATA
jgi:glyoxylase I family protein